MTEEQVVENRLPFHKSILEIIRGALPHELNCLARIIKRTKIPKGHDEIVRAWGFRIKLLGGRSDISTDDFGVSANLLEQKQEAEAETASEAEKRAGMTGDHSRH